MKNWEDFEIECTNYLIKNYGQYAKFTHKGGSDSTVPDIYVETPSGSFYIDAKHTPAQCGQFVLIPDIETSTFEYSKQNASPINTYAQKIMKHMDKSFDEYREAGTAGKTINMSGDQDIFSNWIINYYKEKGTKYFITNNYLILPIERFRNYFDIIATYRIKRSGSSNVGKKRIPIVRDYITSQNYVIQSFHTQNDKLFVASNEQLHDKRFILQEYEYMFSLRGTEFEIRKLSNTYNANVIFSIQLKDNVIGLSSQEFIEALK